MKMLEAVTTGKQIEIRMMDKILREKYGFLNNMRRLSFSFSADDEMLLVYYLIRDNKPSLDFCLVTVETGS
jgi:hypothetical protein